MTSGWATRIRGGDSKLDAACPMKMDDWRWSVARQIYTYSYNQSVVADVRHPTYDAFRCSICEVIGEFS